MREGTLDESEEQFKEAIQLEPMNPEYHFELANLYALRHDELWNMKDDAGAFEKLRASARELEQAVMAKPGFLPAHFNLGVVYKKLAQYENARLQFKEVLKLDPSQTPAMLQIGATYEEQGFYDDAQGVYQDLMERYPGHPDLQNALQGLAVRREKAHREEVAERGMRFAGLQNGLNALGRGSDQSYSNNNSQSAGMAQAIPYLGSWALQQFMKRRSAGAPS